MPCKAEGSGVFKAKGRLKKKNRKNNEIGLKGG